MSVLFPAVYNLFGPAQAQAAYTGIHDGNWITPGSAFTASTAEFDFHFPPFAEPAYAVAQTVWSTQSPNLELRFCHFAPGDANSMTEFAKIIGNGSGAPVPQGVDITTLMQGWRDSQQRKDITFQVRGDSIHSLTLYRVQLYVDWRIPTGV